MQAGEERQGLDVGESQLGLGVLPVQVEVAAQELEPSALELELAGELASPVVPRRVGDHVVGHLVGPLARDEQPLDVLGTGEPPLGQPGGAAVAHVERVVVEVVAHDRVEVPGTTAGSARRTTTWYQRGLPGLRGLPEDGDDGGDHVVDRHDVDDHVRRGGELGQLAAAVGEDQRLGHLEALDPARDGASRARTR